MRRSALLWGIVGLLALLVGVVGIHLAVSLAFAGPGRLALPGSLASRLRADYSADPVDAVVLKPLSTAIVEEVIRDQQKQPAPGTTTPAPRSPTATRGAQPTPTFSPVPPSPTRTPTVPRTIVATHTASPSPRATATASPSPSRTSTAAPTATSVPPPTDTRRPRPTDTPPPQPTNTSPPPPTQPPPTQPPPTQPPPTSYPPPPPPPTQPPPPTTYPLAAGVPHEGPGLPLTIATLGGVLVIGGMACGWRDRNRR